MGVGYNPRIVTDGLVLCLDAANPKSYPGSGTTWTDLSGNAGNGNLINGPTFDSGSLFFDGTNDRVHIASPSRKYAWAPVGTTGNKIMSFELWVKTTDNNNGLILAKPWNSSGVYNYLLSVNSFGTRVGNTQHNLGFTSINDGNWKHIVAIANETQKAVYINGNLSAGFTNHNETSDTPASPGESTWSVVLMSLFPYGDTVSRTEQAIVGNLSVFKIYNKQLSAAEIQQNFNATRGRYGI